jgi:NitT/TauT family transport system ATP-binding protein
MAPFLELSHVTKIFAVNGAAGIHVIDDVSMQVAEGEVVVYLGPSGCGKSTLMRMVGGLETPTSGRIVLEGKEVKGPDRQKGMVFQSYSSFPWLKVIDNVRFGLKFRADLDSKEKDRIARHYLRMVGLSEFEDYWVNRISGGMRQRVAIARTFAAGPGILLMDEPFGALDAQNREFLQLQLRDLCLKERKTVIFVTHDVEEAVFLADRIFVFSARPAKILEEIAIRDLLPPARDFKLRESEAFFRLRNRILGLTRTQAMRSEQIEVQGA